MSRLLDLFGAEVPVIAAPMAGGPTTPELVAAATAVGSFGFLAAGYRSPTDLQTQIDATRRHTDRFGVNLFVPRSSGIDAAVYRAYRDLLAPLADRYDVELPAEPLIDDDHWLDKVDILLAAPPSVVSFTFGIPDAATAEALRRAGVTLAQTVTSAEEAALAEEAGMDLLVVQAPGAGGHSGTFTPERALAAITLPQLVSQVAARSELPIVAGGGVATAADVQAALSAGAVAVAVGTALLLAPEAGTSATHRQALRELTDRPTTLTHAFTGRTARGIRNAFIDRHVDAPFGYPELHHLTQPIRRAAAAAGDAENVHLWAGTGFASIVERTASETLLALADY
jgi:NAD(P)H-dependent flavin oxidoreductase YrpB (nitropropane dioxygenase family)